MSAKWSLGSRKRSNAEGGRGRLRQLPTSLGLPAHYEGTSIRMADGEHRGRAPGLTVPSSGDATGLLPNGATDTEFLRRSVRSPHGPKVEWTEYGEGFPV